MILTEIHSLYLYLLIIALVRLLLSFKTNYRTKYEQQVPTNCQYSYYILTFRRICNTERLYHRILLLRFFDQCTVSLEQLNSAQKMNSLVLLPVSLGSRLLHILCKIYKNTFEFIFFQHSVKVIFLRISGSLNK